MLPIHATPTFSNTFLVSDGDSVLKIVGPSENMPRKVKPHRKSRLGCVNCKRRKVKCDEQLPCANCIKRREICSREKSAAGSGTEPPSAETTPPLTPSYYLPRPENVSVNLLHLELFHHFSGVTVPTLSFPEIWPEMLRLAFQEEFLMNAILAVAATHLSTLVPGNSRYSEVACSFLARSVRDFRENLSAPITLNNCDATFGTAILVHYLAWCDLDFLEGQSPDKPLDLSRDNLFLLSAGIRQIFFMAWPMFQSHQSVFVTAAIYKPCQTLEEIVEMRGIDWKRFKKGFMDLYDNPRYWGGRQTLQRPGVASSDSTRCHSQLPSFDHGHSADSSPCMLNMEDMVEIYKNTGWEALRYLDHVQAMNLANLMSVPLTASKGELARAAYERIATRLAVMIALIADNDSGFGSSGAYAAYSRQFPMPSGSDLSRSVLSFPILIFGPFLPLILGGDSRGLVILFHLYRSTRLLLATSESWWCGKRAAVMESVIQNELRARGLEACLRRQDHVV